MTASVGILNHVTLERELMAYATKAGNAMLGVVSKATAYQLSAPSPKAISILRKRMEEKGCPKGTIDACFAIAKLVAPRIEDAVKASANHADAVAQVEAQITALKGDMNWKDFKASLTPQGNKEEPVATQQEAVSVEPETVEHSEPLSPVEMTLFDRCMANVPNFSGEQRWQLFQLLAQTSDLAALAAMGEFIVSETEVALAEAA